MNERRSDQLSRRRLPGLSGSHGWLYAIGLVLLIGGLQALAFDRQVTTASRALTRDLAELQGEYHNNGRMNESLRALQAYQRASRDEQVKRRLLELRDMVLEQYTEDRRGAVDMLRAGADGLTAQTPAEQGALEVLARRTTALSALYADRSGEVLRRYTAPPWYLQPTASLVNDDPARLHALRFNHALYLVHSGNSVAAATLLESMRDDDHPHRAAEIDFALGRLAFEAWAAEPDPALFAEALARTTRATRADAGQPLPKLFLEYLLSVDRTANTADLEPEEGQGDGEGRGERGVTPTERREF